MEKSGVSAKRSSASPATEHGLARHWDLLVLLLLIIVSVPGAWLSPRTLVVVRNAGLIDDNWHLDEIFKLSRGLWVGRDVAFTHGPIFQWLSAVPARTMGISMGAIYGSWFVMLGWSAFVFTYLTLRRLLPEQPAWKRALPLLFLCLFWAPNLRTSFPILLFAFLLSGWYGVAEGRRRPLLLGAVAALLCGVGVLIASDTGIYSIAALALSLAGAAFEFRRDGRALVRFLIALATFVLSAIVVVLLINAQMARPLDFRFWKESAEMVSVYRWATPFRMTPPGTLHLLGALLGGAAIFLLRTFTRREGSTAMTQRTGFLAGAFVFALVMMQSGLVRSDYGHTVTAVLAMVVFSAAILFSFEGTRAHALIILVALGCSTLFGEQALRPSSTAHNYEQALSPLTECPAGFREYDRGCFQRDFAGMLEASSSYLHEHSSSQDSILVFPYQTLFGIATQRNVAGGLIQPYTASGDYLAQLEIRRTGARGGPCRSLSSRRRSDANVPARGHAVVAERLELARRRRCQLHSHARGLVLAPPSLPRRPAVGSGSLRSAARRIPRWPNLHSAAAAWPGGANFPGAGPQLGGRPGSTHLAQRLRLPAPSA